MKKLMFLFLFPVITYSQTMINESEIDTSSIFFKAKLFTIERKGIFSEKKIYEFTNDLKHEYVKTKDFYFILIKAPEYNFNYDNEKIAIFGNCIYYLVYSIKANKFYKIGGFEENNSLEFSKIFRNSIDVSNYNNVIKNSELKKYLDYIVLKKNKKALKYFPKCADIVTDTVIIK